MASYHGNTHSEPAETEQIITEFFAKSLHIVLESRCPYVSSRHYSGEQTLSSPSSSSSSSSSIRPRDKWFNLALRDCPAALENIDFWRQSNLGPMVVDVILVQLPTDWDPVTCSPRRGLVRNLSSKERFPMFWNSEPDEFGDEAKSEKTIERWIVQYESRTSCRDSCSGSKRPSCTSLHTLYKKSILLLRSLYVTVRLLPAYKLFRELSSSGQIRTFNLSYRVSFVEPFTCREEAEMQRFVFTPVDTSCGRLCLSVLYSSSLLNVSSEPSIPMSPQFIPDYVGSPMADPLKRLPSLPVPQHSPSLSPFGRRHSWSYDLYRASSPSAFPSPSPTHSDSRAAISKPNSHRLPPTNLRCNLSETPQVHMKNTSFDEYWPSPTFSPSPSPSPPIYIPGSNVSKTLLRSESAPVGIRAFKLADTSLLSSKQILPPPPSLKATRPSISKTDKNSDLVQTSSTVETLFSFGKDETGKLPGVKMSSNNSPQKSVSRSSSRWSFEDNYDDSEFSGPFVLDDDNLTDPGNRTGSFDQTRHLREPHELGGFFLFRKSQDSEVGALVHMLKKAQPLCQDLSESRNLLPGSKPEIFTGRIQEPNQISVEPGFQPAASLSIASSGLLASKTTADALEDLRGFREMKDLLLGQGGRSQKWPSFASAKDTSSEGRTGF